MCTDGEGRRNSACLCATAVRRFGKQRSNRNRNRNPLPRPIPSTHTSPLQLNHTVCTQARQSTDSVFTSPFEFRNMAIVAYASVNVAEHAVRTQVKQYTQKNVHILTRARRVVIVAYAPADVTDVGRRLRERPGDRRRLRGGLT